MRILCAVALFVSLSCVKAVTLQSPQAQTQLTPGTPFQVVWGWDSPPRADDGSLDIYLVRDSAATSVVSQLVTGALILYSATSATIPVGTPAGQYYLQLSVTSGTEKSVVGGPFNVATGPTVVVSNSTVTTITVDGATVTAFVVPTVVPPTYDGGFTSSSNTQQGLASGATAGIVIGTLIAFGAIMGAWFIWYKKRQQPIDREMAMNKPLPYRHPSQDPNHFTEYNHYGHDQPLHSSIIPYGRNNGISPISEYPVSVGNQTMPSSDTQSHYQRHLVSIPSVSIQNSHTGSGASTVRQYRPSRATGSFGPATHSSGSSTASPPRSTDTAIYQPAAAEQVTYSPPHTPSSPVLSPSPPPK
ncbi:hypothetical protein INT44_007958 [Umbelopsis vinacea]|uniref:Yeast cell wall synthesis Kre9/Knh1-like N-terminal domain-containing protein n=1 Tax=Umbelopsis vinacea TaxID=44442 RepID=A0A8H7PNP6_9FUNG|nr:hypothetical protein INT44_007958 [Umbelopsis vinacea]